MLCFENLNLDTDQNSVNVESTVEKQQIVSFQQGGDVVHASKPAIAEENAMLISAKESRQHSIYDFLGRPIPIISTTWQTSDNPNALLPGTALAFPQTIWLQDMWAEKMRGFRFFKADLNFQVQVNASPFDTGRLWMFWSPFDAERGDLRPFTTRTNVTGYPGIEVDVGNMMTSTLTVPYCSPYSHIDQTQNNQPYGTFRITVMSQFFSNNDTIVDVTVWCWLTNVELTVPTSITNLGGISMVAIRRKYEKEKRILELKKEQRLRESAVKHFKLLAQGNRYVEQNKMEMAVEVMRTKDRMHTLNFLKMRAQSGREATLRSKTGLISGGAEIVGAAAKAFANVPVIGEFAKPLSWVADATKGVASLIGMSKPTGMQVTQTMAQVPGKGFTHCDGLDQSVVLGTKPDIEIQNSFEVFGTKEDEMNIPYIVGKPNWIQAFNWAMTSAPKADALWTCPVHPGICGTDPSTGFTGTWYSPTQMAMVASAFRYWRGGIKFRFTAVKNGFYSGRLTFVFYPGLRDAEVGDYSTQDVNMCYKWIWDCKRDTEIELTIPYCSNAQWLRVRMHNNLNAPERIALTTDTILGTLAVFVDNRLRGPPTVPDNFWIHVWVSGASDLTFACPDMVKYGNYQAVPPAALYALAAVEEPESLVAQCGRCDRALAMVNLEFISTYTCEGKIYLLYKDKHNGQIKLFHVDQLPEAKLRAQMLRVERSMDVNHKDYGKEDPEGSALLTVSHGDNMNPEMFCIGEIHNNLRPLTRRFCIEFGWSTAANSTYTLDPAWFFESNTSAARSAINYFSRMYVFYRGSVRYKILRLGTQNDPTTYFVTQVKSSQLISSSPINYGTVPDQPGDEGGRFTHTQYTALNPIVEVTCPFYSNVPIQLVSRTYITALHLRLVYMLTDNAGTTNRGSIRKAAGDDFSFGYLVGAPAIQDYSAL